MTQDQDSVHLLEVSGLTVDYRGRSRASTVRANDNVSLHLDKGETLGIVGESGSGKSTLGDAILGFAPVSSGTIRFKGEDIAGASAQRRRELTRQIQVIFQNPYGSLNPSRTVGQILEEPLLAHRIERDPRLRRRHVEKWLDLVGLPASARSKYPADFSGGQRQRIAVARALLIEPELVVCDEAVSALDLSIQAQILNLLVELQDRMGVSYLFITHDMAVVEHVSQRIAVMHRGRIVESGPAEDVIRAPQDAYTKALIDAVPAPDPTAAGAAKERRHER